MIFMEPMNELGPRAPFPTDTCPPLFQPDLRNNHLRLQARDNCRYAAHPRHQMVLERKHVSSGEGTHLTSGKKNGKVERDCISIDYVRTNQFP